MFCIIGPDGARSMPLRLEDVERQALEGRICPETVLLDPESGVRLTASAVPGLMFAYRVPAGMDAPAPAWEPSPGSGAPGLPTQPDSGRETHPAGALYETRSAGALDELQEQPGGFDFGLVGSDGDSQPAIPTAEVAPAAPPSVVPAPEAGRPTIPAGYVPAGYIPPGYVPQGYVPAPMGFYGVNGPPPREVLDRKWNWGAFMFPILWLLFNGMPGWGLALLFGTGLLSLVGISFLLFPINIVVACYSSRWCWQHRRFFGAPGFLSVYKAWDSAGLVVLALIGGIFFVGLVYAALEHLR